MNRRLVTIVGYDSFFSKNPFWTGRIMTCRKLPENCYGTKSIRVENNVFGTVGSFCDWEKKLAPGTVPVHEIYDSLPDVFQVKISKCDTFVVAEIL